jgi:tRNA(Ile2) C34 agmatinyltransferase TiaS
MKTKKVFGVCIGCKGNIVKSSGKGYRCVDCGFSYVKLPKRLREAQMRAIEKSMELVKNKLPQPGLRLGYEFRKMHSSV